MKREFEMTASSAQQNKTYGPTGALYDLLLEKLPSYITVYGGHKRLAIYPLAEAVGVSYQYLYQCFNNGNVSLKMGRKLIVCSEQQTETPAGFEPLTINDLEPYLPA